MENTNAIAVDNETAKAISFQTALELVNLAAIPVMTKNRHIPRKEQAALARELFKRIGIKGVSVRTPNYSMASSVDVFIPRRCDYVFNEYRQVEYASDPASIANQSARGTILAILAAAFPNHDDRSEYVSDYFDFCWSVA